MRTIRVSIPTISAEQLRQMLDEGQPVTVLDVRPAAERAEWSIPGSAHVDAYDALRRGDPDVLQRFDAPAHIPVVTVCAAGNTSLLAAERLRERGYAAASLAGGMRAWSLAWNAAEVPSAGAARILQVRRTGKGCLSYIVASQGKAVVIDPSLDAQVYADLAAARGWRIRAVIETHVHADHLSRARSLVADMGATLFLPLTNRVSFPYEPLGDGDVIELGSSRLRMLHTPGHTPESSSYLLDDRTLFTGDTLFLEAVGRPDLEASPEEARRRSHLLYRSLRRLLELPGETMVLPAHTNRPVAFDRQPIVSELHDVRRRIAVLRAGVSEFVDQILRRIPPTPPNHQRIVALNEVGDLPDGDPAALEAGANRCAVA